MLGKKQLEQLLVRLGLMPDGAALPQAFPQVRLGGVRVAAAAREVFRQYNCTLLARTVQLSVRPMA